MHLRQLLSMTVLCLISFFATTAQAQVPQVAGLYQNEKGLIFEIDQQAEWVTISVTIPEVASTEFKGRYQAIEYTDGTRGMGFYGNFATRFASGKPAVEGVGYLLPIDGETVSCESFIVREGLVQAGVQQVLTRQFDHHSIAPPSPTVCQSTKQRGDSSSVTTAVSQQGNQVTKSELRSDDAFNLLPNGGLDRLGL